MNNLAKCLPKILDLYLFFPLRTAFKHSFDKRKTYWNHSHGLRKLSQGCNGLRKHSKHITHNTVAVKVGRNDLLCVYKEMINYAKKVLISLLYRDFLDTLYYINAYVCQFASRKQAGNNLKNEKCLYRVNSSSYSDTHTHLLPGTANGLLPVRI